MENQNSPQQQAADLRMMLENESSQQRSSRRNSRGTTLSDIDTMSYDELVAYISDSNSDFAEDDTDFEEHSSAVSSSNNGNPLFSLTKQSSHDRYSTPSVSASKSLEDERREEEERAKRAVPYSFASLNNKQPSGTSNNKTPEDTPDLLQANAAKVQRRAAMSAMRITTPDPEEYPEYYQQQSVSPDNLQSPDNYSNDITTAETNFSDGGFDADGYDAEGFDRDGFDHDGFDREGFDKYNYDREGYDWEGYDSEGFDREGFDRDGFDKYNYDREGYDWEGYNSEGFDREGFDRDGFDKYNYDREGYDWEGYNQYGLDRQGFNRNGLDAEGFDREGFDADGFDREGFDRDGFDRYNYNREGYDWEGYDCEGYDYGGFDRDGYDKEGYTRQDWEAAGYKFGPRGEFILPENEAANTENSQAIEDGVDFQAERNTADEASHENNEIEAAEVEQSELYPNDNLSNDESSSAEISEPVEEIAPQSVVTEAANDNGEAEREVSLDNNSAKEVQFDDEAETSHKEEYLQEGEQQEYDDQEYQHEDLANEAEQQEYDDQEYQHEDLTSEAEQQEYNDQEYQHEDLTSETEQQEYDDQEYQHEDLTSETEQQEYDDQEYQHEDLTSETEQQEYNDQEYQHEDLTSETEQQEYDDQEYQHENVTSEADSQIGTASQAADTPRSDVPLYEPEQHGKFGNMTSPWRYECDYAIDYESGSRRGQRITLLASEMGDERTFTIGSPGERVNDIEVDESSIANDQALLRYNNGRFTFINFQEDIKINKRIITCGEQVNLMTGDEIALGGTTLVFRERCISEALAEYSLDVIEGAETDLNKSFPLTKQRSSIGRDRNSDILLTDQEISRNHCTLTFRNGKFYLQHRSDTNPTFINGVSVPAGGERQITTDDKIQISSRTILQLIKH